MTKEEYHTYLESREWRAKREWALERAGHACQVCNSRKDLHVHHRTYDNVGAELPGDLTVLCAQCHELFHNKQGGKPQRKSLGGKPPPPEYLPLLRQILKAGLQIACIDT